MRTVLINKYGLIKYITAPTAPVLLQTNDDKEQVRKLNEGTLNFASIFLHVPNKMQSDSIGKEPQFFIQDTTLKKIKSHPQSRLQVEVLELTNKEANRLLKTNFITHIEKILFSQKD